MRNYVLIAEDSAHEKTEMRKLEMLHLNLMDKNPYKKLSTARMNVGQGYQNYFGHEVKNKGNHNGWRE